MDPGGSDAHAIHDATQDAFIRFVRPIVNDWEARACEDEAYWAPDPGSIESGLQTASVSGAPGLVLTRACVMPADVAVVGGGSR